MEIKGVIEEDFLNYKEPSMFILFPYCDWKCCTEAGNNICQNLPLAKQPNIEVKPEALVDKFMNNDITKAVVCGGLEPLYQASWLDLYRFIKLLREKTNAPVVIYTGYRNDEVEYEVDMLKKFPNIIIKFGRFIPNQEPHFDPLLGVQLASLNQYATKIS